MTKNSKSSSLILVNVLLICSFLHKAGHLTTSENFCHHCHQSREALEIKVYNSLFTLTHTDLTLLQLM